MISTHISCDHNTYHIRFRDTWLQREKEATRPFTFQPKALEMFENQYKSELLIRSHPRGRGFESLQVHHKSTVISIELRFWPCPPAEKRPAEKRSRQRRHHTGGILPPAEGVLKKQRGRTYMGSPPLINVYFTRVPEQQRFFAAAKQHRLFDQAHFFRYCFIISPRMGIQRAMSSSPVVEKFSRMAFLPLPSQQKN